MIKEFLSKEGLQTFYDQLEIIHAKFMKGLQAGTNVTITGDPKNPVISVSGVDIPEKFSSTDTITGAIGAVIPGQDFTKVTALTPGAVFNPNDVVIFANGALGQVTAYNSGAQTFDVVVIQIPIATAWGAISGSIAAQTDLKAALDALQPLLTAGAGISIAANGTISVNVVSDTLAITTQAGAVKIEVVPIPNAEIEAMFED